MYSISRWPGAVARPGMSSWWVQRAMSRIELIQKEIDEYYWDFLLTSDLIELRNITTVAKLIVLSALSRHESRGLHYTIDYPEKDDVNFLHDTIIPGAKFQPTGTQTQG